MDDLVAWLRTQLDEDERVAKACQEAVGTTRVGEMYFDGSGPAERDDFPSYPWGISSDELAFISGHDPARVLREVEAKRRIVDDLARYASDTEAWEAGSPDTDGLAIRTLALLALPYADRPGYRDEWKP